MISLSVALQIASVASGAVAAWTVNRGIWAPLAQLVNLAVWAGLSIATGLYIPLLSVALFSGIQLRNLWNLRKRGGQQ